MDIIDTMGYKCEKCGFEGTDEVDFMLSCDDDSTGIVCNECYNLLRSTKCAQCKYLIRDELSYRVDKFGIIIGGKIVPLCSARCLVLFMQNMMEKKNEN